MNEEPNLTIRFKLILTLGGKCRMCLNDKPEELELDHIYNDGDSERAKYGSAEVYRYYYEHQLKAFQRLQVLCKDCHDVKHQIEYKPKYNIVSQEPSKIRLFIDCMKNLEGERKKPVNLDVFIEALIQDDKFESDTEVRRYLKKLQRESCIYESKPNHYNVV